MEGFEPARFEAEIEIFTEMLKEEKVENCSKAFKQTKILSCLNRMYKVLLTLPVTSCEAEHSFSTFRRLKTYLRNHMTSQRCSNLARMTVHRELVEQIDQKDVIKLFKSKKYRRMYGIHNVFYECL